jgi:spore coat polysaccharide biosynthesis predicted glycosyltransferase SpsG
MRFDGGGNVGFGHASRCAALIHALDYAHGLTACAYIRPNRHLESYLADHGIPFRFVPDAADETAALRAILEDPQNSLIVIDRIYPYSQREVAELAEQIPVFMIHNDCQGLAECHGVVFPVAHLSTEREVELRKRVRRGLFRVGFDFVMLGHGALASPRLSPQGYVGLTTGASDPAGIMLRVLGLLASTRPVPALRAFYGRSFSELGALDVIRPTLPDWVSVAPFDTNALFRSAAAICAFGVTAYELLYRGIPFASIGHTVRAVEGSAILAERLGLPTDLGALDSLAPQSLGANLKNLSDVSMQAEFRRATGGLVDGLGVRRVSQLVAEINETDGRFPNGKVRNGSER